MFCFKYKINICLITDAEEEAEMDGKMKLRDLMERLRHRVSQHRSWTEAAKSLRSSLIVSKTLHLSNFHFFYDQIMLL